MEKSGIGLNNTIHPTSIIGPNVVLGNNNYIGPFCYIMGDTIIGDNNRFEAYCSIGTPAEHKGYFEYTDGKTIIGNNNIFREYVSVHQGTEKTTTLGDDIKMQRNSHLGHDSTVENSTTLSCNVIIGGFSYIMEGVNFGLGSICHQRSIIGAYTMMGMGCIITKSNKIEPGKVYIGAPATYLKDNTLGLEKHNVNKEYFNLLVEKYNNL